jgi:hypothetical protein
MSYLVEGGKPIIEWQWEKEWHAEHGEIPAGKMLTRNVYGEAELVDTVQPSSFFPFALMALFWFLVIVGGTL